MTFNEYQHFMETVLKPGADTMEYAILEMAGEVGEIADKYKKVLRDDTELDARDLAFELGDVLFGVANCARQLGYSLDDIARFNVAKLTSRKQRGVIGGSGDNR